MHKQRPLLAKPGSLDVAMGPKRDIVGDFKKAAERQDLRFAVSEHLAPSYYWFSISHTSDQTGPLAGVSYDGANPAYASLYHDLPRDYPYGQRINDRKAPAAWKMHYFQRIKDLIDNYLPDLLYTDGDIFYEEYGLALVANLYNTSANRHDGRSEAVYNSKLPSDCQTGTCVLDWERGVAERSPENPWQTDTCIGDWHYNRQVCGRFRRELIRIWVVSVVITLFCAEKTRCEFADASIALALPKRGDPPLQCFSVCVRRYIVTLRCGLHQSTIATTKASFNELHLQEFHQCLLCRPLLRQVLSPTR